MAKVRVNAFSVSADGFGAGPDQDRDQPLGRGGEQQARLIDEMHLAISPVLLGRGEPLFAGIDLPALGYGVKEHRTTPAAMHLLVAR